MAHATFNWQDPFLLDSQLTGDERMVRDAAAAQRLFTRLGFRATMIEMTRER